MVIDIRPQTIDAQAATVARARAGETGALVALIEQHERPLYHFILSLVRDAEDASDVAQDVWLQVATHLPELRDTSRFTPWLYRIARHRCLWLIRTRRKTVEHGAERPVELEACGDADGTLEQHVLSLDERRKVWEALGGLSQQDRTALFLRDQLELPYPEVAEVLGVSRNAAQVRVFRARERFRQCFQAVDAAAPRCEVSLLQLGAFVDGGLSAGSAAWVREHLGSCGECSERAAAMHDGRRLYRQLGLVVSPPGLLAAVAAHTQLVLGGSAGSGVAAAIGWKVAAAVVTILAVAVSSAPDVPVRVPSTMIDTTVSAPVTSENAADGGASSVFVLDSAAGAGALPDDEAGAVAPAPTALAERDVTAAVRPGADVVDDNGQLPAAAAAADDVSSAEPTLGVSSAPGPAVVAVRVSLPSGGGTIEASLDGSRIAVAIPEVAVVLPQVTAEIPAVSGATDLVVGTASEVASTLAADLSPVLATVAAVGPQGTSDALATVLPATPVLPSVGAGLALFP